VCPRLPPVFLNLSYTVGYRYLPVSFYR
jgi:hypothetical protein